MYRDIIARVIEKVPPVYLEGRILLNDSYRNQTHDEIIEETKLI